ncbi:MAG: 4-(cytidine 5'-diphospho)-2-C-methyl-D-erythritol kinase [Campylobacterota bacterium]|nr:4-(cytidine 5'-diphospho)-2-C-methyl-D-erythritol kinase [Campylobacterota bacterium]
MIMQSYAKVNIFLKIAGKRDNYHELVSRFVRVKNLFDTIEFKKCDCKEFTLEGSFGCPTKSNTIYKAYEKLCEVSNSVKNYFQHNKVIVNKNIPEFAGLGGGSSNCATFIIMVNEVCNLQLSKDKLSTIAVSIGADVPFFIYEYDSANVTGIGEIVEKFNENSLDIETFTPKIKCNTGAIFKQFREDFYSEVSDIEANKLLKMKSIDILNKFDIFEVNDLYRPALEVYSDLIPSKFSLPNNSFFSGSGSSFFYIKG